MIGNGFDSAKKSFYTKLNKNYDVARNLLIFDQFLLSQLPNLTVEIPITKPIDLETEQILKDILEIIGKSVDKNYIDTVCTLYLSGQLGVPNSIENKGRLIDNINKFNKLKKEHRDNKNLIDFKSLQEIENFVDSKKDIFKKMEEDKKNRLFLIYKNN